ncbi:MAG: hypothetical protein RL039_1375 [Pseudomonadota bacterium]
MLIQPLPAFNDNYLWLAHDGKNAVVVDPGDAQPVLAALQAQQLTLQAIVLTHHHGDHTGGVAALRQATQCRVLGPAQEKLPEPVERVHAGQRIALLGTDWLVLAVPGHTAGHIAWYAPDLVAGGALFCGDTLFSGGCGRLFEGTAAQMHASLQQLAALPASTQVFCAHEYTLSNLRFALAVEPDNAVLQQYQHWCQQQRDHGLPTLPSTMAQELAINPFLRCNVPTVQRSAVTFDPTTAPTPEATLATLRAWKNVFA